MFIDEAKVFVESGSGGNGCLSFRREKNVPRGGPDGGDGGSGGSVIIRCSRNKQTLIDVRYHSHLRSGDGGHGKGGNKHGKNAGDVILEVPVGTTVHSGPEKLADLVCDGQWVLVAKGGAGGRGNRAFKTQRNTAPKIFEKGKPGVKVEIWLELKLIADVGIIGFPNVGKSSLLSRISSAHPKIANYPFTTLAPNLGVVKLQGYANTGSFVVADIPGLIEGAHMGKGLGDKFLRHVERTRLLIHMLDIFNFDEPAVEDRYSIVNKELKLHSRQLSRKEQVVVVNKIDLPGVKEKIRAVSKRIKKKIYPVSAVTGEGIKELICAIRGRLREVA